MLPQTPSHVRLLATAALLAASATACGPNPQDGSPPAPAPSAAVCDKAATVLRVSRAHGDVSLAFAAGASPKVLVDLSSAPGTEHTVVSVRGCASGAAAITTTVDGKDNFTLDPALYSALAAAGCVRLGVVAMRGGVAAASTNAVLRFGDASLAGEVALEGPGAPSAIDRVRLDVQIDAAHFFFDVVGDGKFNITQLPAGRLLRVTAIQKGSPTRPTLRGSAAPLVTLDAAHPNARVHIGLRSVPAAIDAFEPDDSIADVATRKPLAFGATEAHSLPSKVDVDVVPLAVAAGSTYQLRVTPLSSRPGDYALVLTDAQSNVLAHANDAPGDFSTKPSVTFTAQADGVLFARITRNDDEPSTTELQVALDRIATAP